MNNTNCPCGRSKNYHDCCEIIHSNITLAKTPEDVMRSRYTAFVRTKIDYLLQSWSSKTRDNSSKAKKELLAWAKAVTWVKLDVLHTSFTSPNTGTVEFKAFFYENGTLECIHENSLFTIENGHWVYVGEV
ncbi:YchJ family protein [Aquimarina agarilytica]|uniref:YchJ family protein n=1 Tax=Aquimarina agarilytica TaxID=1087449 RepID=UPI000289E03B|nr:YchJ family metal-binding protein [Aquimarina agarilytica]